jgi:hypothetical protein
MGQAGCGKIFAGKKGSGVQERANFHTGRGGATGNMLRCRMSIHTSTFSFLSLKPGIRRNGPCLVFESTPWAHALSLFSHWQRVELNGESKWITVQHKSWWFQKHCERIHFSLVEETGFTFQEWRSGRPRWGNRYEQIWLVLKLKTRRELVKLVPFEGEGSQETGFVGVLFGDSLVDFRGDHAERACEAKTLVDEMLGFHQR